MVYRKLYKKDTKGRVRVWYIEQSCDKYRIYNGLLDGNLVVSEWSVAKSKNIGRSNETSGEQQATFEVESEYTKKLKRGYVYDLTDINKKKFQCTLAKEYLKYLDKVDFSTGQWIAQTKFNGCRCIINKNGAFTRTGEPMLTVPHIISEFKNVFEQYPDAIFDGELFNYDLREELNELIKLVRKTVNINLVDLEQSKEKVQYHVYDGYLSPEESPLAYNVRYDSISRIVEPLKYSYIVNGIIINSKEELDDFYKEQLNDKQEGIVLRNVNIGYEQKRSNNLLKYKPVDDDEAIILLVNEGTGNWSNTAKTATIKWKDKQFDATFLGSQSELTNVWNNRLDYLNKQIKFKYNGLTGLGIPNYARIDLKDSSSVK